MTPPEHDRANWHLAKVGMSNVEIVVNIGLTLVTCGAWLPIAILWYIAVFNRQGWVYVPPGSQVPAPVSGGSSWRTPLVVLGAFGALLVVAVIVGVAYGH